jgi:hypothetical protein
MTKTQGILARLGKASVFLKIAIFEIFKIKEFYNGKATTKDAITI